MEDLIEITKILATRTSQVSKETCTTKKCIDKEVTTYFLDRCWIKHLELGVKYSLRQIRTKRSNDNLRRGSAPTELKWKGSSAIPEMDSWQSKILAIEDRQGNCWMIDPIEDVHVWNNRRLMTKYRELLIEIGESILDRISPERKKIQLCLTIKDDLEGLVLNFHNIFYLSNSPYNLISLGLRNDSSIFYNNEIEILY